MREEVQRQAALKAEAGSRFDYAAFANIGFGGLGLNGSEVEHRAVSGGSTWLHDLALRVTKDASTRNARSSQSNSRESRIARDFSPPSRSGSSSSLRPMSKQMMRNKSSSSLLQTAASNDHLCEDSMIASADTQRQYENAIFMQIWKASQTFEWFMIYMVIVS